MIRAAGALAAPLVVSVMNRYSRAVRRHALTGHRGRVGGYLDPRASYDVVGRSRRRGSDTRER